MNAAKCIHLAGRTADDEARRFLIECSDSWLTLAEFLERSEQGWHAARPKGLVSPPPGQLLTVRLAQAQRHVLQGKTIIARQEALIARLKRDGHDTSEAEVLLVKFQETQRMHKEDAAAIRKKLDALVKTEMLTDLTLAEAVGTGLP